jgi:hypothetical protein
MAEGEQPEQWLRCSTTIPGAGEAAACGRHEPQRPQMTVVTVSNIKKEREDEEVFQLFVIGKPGI